MSLFITFEGGEGSGKSTQIQMLAHALKARGKKVVVTREPGGTRIGASIRQILLHRENHEIHPVTEWLLYAADRAQHVLEVIRPALKADQIVLCDRFSDATLAYQGYARGLDPASIERLNEQVTGGLKPSLTFLLDCSVEIGLKRSKARLSAQSSPEDRFEQEDLKFHEKVRRAYLDLAQREPKRFVILDATLAAELVHSLIIDHVERRL